MGQVSILHRCVDFQCFLTIFIFKTIIHKSIYSRRGFPSVVHHLWAVKTYPQVKRTCRSRKEGDLETGPSRPHWAVNIVACIHDPKQWLWKKKPVTRQQIPDMRQWTGWRAVFSARPSPMDAHARMNTATEERCFLCGPRLDVISSIIIGASAIQLSEVVGWWVNELENCWGSVLWTVAVRSW
jgi:hypothetical protein